MSSDDMEPPVDLTGTAQTVQPPDGLESRVVGSLVERGLLGTGGAGTPSWRRYAIGALAAAALLMIGMALGSWRARPTADPRPQYLLLLYDDDTSASLGAAVRDSVVAEYQRWARQLREIDRFVLGEELGGLSAVVPASAGREPRLANGSVLGGFFIIRADDLPSALEIARQTPHVRRGGTVVVRPINPT